MPLTSSDWASSGRHMAPSTHHARRAPAGEREAPRGGHAGQQAWAAARP